MPCTHYFSVDGGKYGPANGRGVQAATSLALGAQCGMTDIEAILKAHAQLNHYGLDLISAPVVIAFAMECYQRGIIGRDTTEGLDLSWANANDAVLEAIELMGQNEGFGRLLNRGVKALSQEWGERDKIIRLPRERDGDHGRRPPGLADMGTDVCGVEQGSGSLQGHVFCRDGRNAGRRA